MLNWPVDSRLYRWQMLSQPKHGQSSIVAKANRIAMLIASSLSSPSQMASVIFSKANCIAS